MIQTFTQYNISKKTHTQFDGLLTLFDFYILHFFLATIAYEYKYIIVRTKTQTKAHTIIVYVHYTVCEYEYEYEYRLWIDEYVT